MFLFALRSTQMQCQHRVEYENVIRGGTYSYRSFVLCIFRATVLHSKHLTPQLVARHFYLLFTAATCFGLWQSSGNLLQIIL